MKKPAQISHVRDLKPDDKNARRHNPRNVGVIVDALHQVGAARSIVVDENGVILAGNATVEAAGEAGITKVKVVEADGNELVAVRRTGLTEEQKRRLSLYDNRAAELAEWDETMLAQLVKEGVDTKAMWTDKELTALLSRANGDEPLVEAPEAQVDRGEELRQKWGVELGQVWECGRHRIVCGDSTESQIIEMALSNGKAQMIFTDPPYGVNFQGVGGHSIAGDISYTLIPLFFSLLEAMLSKAGWCYVCGASANVTLYGKMFERYLNCVPKVIVWDKGTHIIRHNGYHSSYEFIFYGFKGGAGDWWFSERSGEAATDVWRISKPTNSERLHLTEKPIELPSRAIMNTCPPDGIVFDPFLGSGTTLVACERLNRVGRGVEIDPRYVAVSLERLSQMSLTPQLVGKVDVKP